MLATPLAIPFFGVATTSALMAATLAAMLALTLRMALRIYSSAGALVAAAYVPFSVLRAFWRGVGFAAGVAAKALRANRSSES